MARGKGTRLRKPTFANRLVIMTKSPRRGAVKRRLACEIGEGAALRFYRSCLSHSLTRLANDPRWLTLLAVAPDHEVATGRDPVDESMLLGDAARGPAGQLALE